MKRENIQTDGMVLIGSARFMEDIFESGLYKRLKTSENKLDQIKGAIKNYCSGDMKRYPLPGGVIGKYIREPVYQTDELGLKEFLNDYGILPLTVSLKGKAFKEEPDLFTELTPFQKPVKRFVQFYLNKKGKESLDKNNYNFDEASIRHLSSVFLEEKTRLEDTKARYKKILREIEYCPFLQQAETVKSTYGTCKLRKKDIEFDVTSIYNKYGSNLLMEYGRISMETIEEYIAKGYFSHKDIQQFRKIVDINLKFLVMDEESEQKQAEVFHQKLIRMSQKFRYA